MQEQVMQRSQILWRILVIAGLAALAALGALAAPPGWAVSPARADTSTAAPARPEPSGPLKAYKGPEGEIVIMVEANEGKQMLVHCKNVDKEVDGKTLLYLFEDFGKDNKTVYINKKRGSKTYRSVLLVAREYSWDFFHPSKPSRQFAIRYSAEVSEKFKIEDVLNAYKP